MNPLVARVGRGLVVSVATTLLTASILVVLAVGAGVRAGVANVIAVICGIGPSYVGNRRFVWRREGRASLVNEVLPFWTLSLAGLATSTVAVTRVAAWSHGRSATLRAIALPTASLAVFGGLWIVQFLLCDRVIFRERRATVVTASAKQRSTREGEWGVVLRHSGVEGKTALGVLLTVAVLTALVIHVGASRSARAAGISSASGLSVFVGYAEDKEINTPDPASFPVPWAGAPNVTFLGGTVPGQTACGSLALCYDAGAIRLDNAGSSAITVGRVSVDVHSSVSGGKVFNNLWGSFTVPANRSVILTENPPTSNPTYDNFDTSSYPNNNCTPLTVAPTVTITVGGVATTLADTSHVLDTGGIDAGSCPPKHNESIQWRPIGAAGTNVATISLSPATFTTFAGTPATETATLLDGAGDGLANVTVGFSVTSGPNAGVSGTGVTDGTGRASFTYTGSAQGEDTLVASVTSVGTFQSNITHRMWTDDSTNGWTSSDIGSSTPPGSDALDTTTGTWTVQGGGRGIGGSSDEFHLVSKSLFGSGGVAARVTSQTNAAGNAKAGVMLRASTDPASAYYAAFVTPGGGVTVEERASSAAIAATIATPAGTAPTYLWVRNEAGTVTAYGSGDGYTWTAIPGSTVTLNLGPSLLAGLAVTSNDLTTLNLATMDSVVVGSAAPGPAPAISCPLSWSCADIGNPTPAGSQSYDPNTGTWTLIAGGADITGSSDQFHFVWQTLAGDGSISARVVSQTNTSSNAKAGVMLRASSDPGAPNYAVLVSPGAGIKVQVRRTQGGTTTKLANPTGTTPAYLKVTRSGNTFTAYTSADGATWNLVTGSTSTMALGTSLLEGLAATSHNSGALSTVTTNHVAAT